MKDHIIFEALADEVAATILTHTTERERSADELAELVDASESTVRRRIERLVDAGLLIERLQLDRQGDHYHIYRTAIKRVEARLENETIDVHVEHREDGVDRFVRLWEDMRGDR
ncbi:ArsR/SmtB family transcription factor [Halosolutus halophilus]|uniref:ArsR/SmtB family transcription factor n=1 Tax=Halosolutus halophilus TaxID=1552990 RepID=UPI0022351DA9|nr:winged helix-turn-helix domain-containing protein [Halosolutus halophilus]